MQIGQDRTMIITFLGGGNMASAMIGGALKKGYRASDIRVVEIDAPRRESLREELRVEAFASPEQAIPGARLVVLAVKPQQMFEVAVTIAPLLEGQLVVSIAAGIRTADLSRWLGNYPGIVRVMPNMPALALAGMCVLYALPGVVQEDRIAAQTLMGAVGETLWVETELAMDAVTAVSGSGPAYVFYFIEALQEAARQLGLDSTAARTLSLQTFLGAARLAAQSTEDVETLRGRVTSKGGTTEAAMRSMIGADVKAQIIHAVAAAADRSREIGDEFGKAG